MNSRSDFARLESQWLRLADRYLPVVIEGSPWRAAMGSVAQGPAQGWKLHLSATILSAVQLLRQVGPILEAHDAAYKGPSNLVFLDWLNTGLDGYSQVGKCLTVYCRDDSQALELAEQLRIASADIPHPSVPFDKRYGNTGAVYYRYGAFDDLWMEDGTGKRVAALLDPAGNLVPDARDGGPAVPTWVEDVLGGSAPAEEAESLATPLAREYRAFSVLRRRGKGGVFLAFDVTGTPARLCVLKEGVRHGETGPDGTDGHDRIANEGRCLRALHRAGVRVPRVLAEFVIGHDRYLVLEHIEGATLQEVLARESRLSPDQGGALIDGLEALIDSIHSAGWAWRDCKPENILVTADGGIWAVDFEGACLLHERDAPPWTTPTYGHPVGRGGRLVDPEATDAHSLRVIREEICTAAGLTGKPTMHNLNAATAGRKRKEGRHE